MVEVGAFGRGTDEDLPEPGDLDIGKEGSSREVWRRQNLSLPAVRATTDADHPIMRLAS